MAICHPHNLRHPVADERHFGIQITLRPESPFRRLLGEDWSKNHWYATAQERDAALLDMKTQPKVYRIGDIADVVFKKVDKSA